MLIKLKNGPDSYLLQLIVLINANPTNNIFSIGGRTDANNNNDFLFMQLDANFNVISNKTIGGLGSEECNAIIAYNDGYLMAGNSNSFSSDLDLFLVYVDQDGDVVWQRVFQNEGDDFAEDIILLSDGGIAILGNKITNSKSQGVLLKLDPLGFIR